METKSDKYPPRTYANAKDSDGTIRIASNFDSPGEVCTLKAIEQYNKPYIDVEYRQPRSAQEVANWIRENNIDVLNVAGNRETFAPGIQRFVEEYLTEVFRLLK